MEKTVAHLTTAELEAGLDTIKQAPKDSGCLEMIVQRPDIGERITIEEGELSLEEGLLGDNWKDRPNAHPEMQLNVMNARSTALVAQDRDRWALAGDELYVDLISAWKTCPSLHDSRWEKLSLRSLLYPIVSVQNLSIGLALT